MFRGPLALPRHAFSPRETARAGDLWRACQEVAVMASTDAGWPPSRYRAEGNAFVVRSMAVVHHKEPLYGDALFGRSWLSRFRREMLCTREVRIDTEAGEPVAVATQEWAHVSQLLQPARAPSALMAAFPVEPSPSGDVGAQLPPIHDGFRTAAFETELEVWDVWMDPLDHVNHPVYVDFCDEALSRHLRARGIAPATLVPVAEEVSFKGGVRAGERVTVTTTPSGWTAAGAAVFDHVIRVGDRVAANATTVRALFGELGPSRLLPR